MFKMHRSSRRKCYKERVSSEAVDVPAVVVNDVAHSGEKGGHDQAELLAALTSEAAECFTEFGEAAHVNLNITRQTQIKNIKIDYEHIKLEKRLLLYILPVRHQHYKLPPPFTIFIYI